MTERNEAVLASIEHDAWHACIVDTHLERAKLREIVGRHLPAGVTISELVERSHALAREKGWYELWPDGKARISGVNVPEKIALIHSEVSEALEEYRKHGVRLRCPDCNGDGKCPKGADEHCWKCAGEGFLEAYAEAMTADPDRKAYTLASKPEGFVVELADVCIRIFDLCGALGLDLAAAIETKHAYNATRSFRHGGKKA